MMNKVKVFFSKLFNKSSKKTCKGRSKWYYCSRQNCSSHCPGHFDPANEPVCKRKDGWYKRG